MTSLLGRLPRIHEQATTHVASNFWTAAPVLRKSFFIGNGQTWNGDAAKGNGQRKATAYLNPGQIPITAFDQPLFAIAKFVQWNLLLVHGESRHVVMCGGLHIKMAL